MTVETCERCRQPLDLEEPRYGVLGFRPLHHLCMIETAADWLRASEEADRREALP